MKQKSANPFLAADPTANALHSHINDDLTARALGLPNPVKTQTNSCGQARADGAIRDGGMGPVRREPAEAEVLAAHSQRMRGTNAPEARVVLGGTSTRALAAARDSSVCEA